MKTIGNIFGALIDIILIPFTILLAVLLPIMSLSYGSQIIGNGISFANSNMLEMAGALCFLMYITLRFKSTQKVYFAFPALFEILKMFLIAGIFTATAEEILNFAFEEDAGTRRMIGIAVYITVLVLWRIAVSIYYTKKPIVPFLEKKQENLRQVAKPEAEEKAV